MPPDWMWHLGDELNEWFEGVIERREERFGARNDDREVVPMMKNEL